MVSDVIVSLIPAYCLPKSSQQTLAVGTSKVEVLMYLVLQT